VLRQANFKTGIELMHMAPPMYAAAPTTLCAVSDTGSLLPHALQAEANRS